MSATSSIPWSEEAEKGVLGCILLSPVECMVACEEVLPEPEDFYDLRHVTIYREFQEMFRSSLPIDILTVVQRLRDKDLIESVGGMDYIASLQDSTPSAANLSYYLEAVREKSLSRRVIRICEETALEAREFSTKGDDMLESLEQKLIKIRSRITIGSTNINDLVSRCLTRIEEMVQSKTEVDGISTGLTDLDKFCGGLHPGEMTVIAGYPGSGKTSLAMNIAEHALLAQSKSVAVFSLEMPSDSLVLRFLCSHSRVNLRNIKRGFVDADDFKNIAESGTRIASSRLYLEDDSDITIHRLRAKARRLWQKHKIQLLVLDYIQLLTSGGGAHKTDSRQEEVAAISRNLKAAARELSIPVIALSQLNDDGRLRESRAIGQDADNIWILSVPETTNAIAVPVKLTIAKARNGPIGFCNLVFLKNITRFENRAKDQDEI